MDMFEPSLPDGTADEQAIRPLADRMRPSTLDEFEGQEQIVGPDTPLRRAIENDKVSSIVFWGPPGTGKTTLARLIANTTHGQFIRFSAVTSGIKEVKVVLSKAGDYYRMSGRRTYVFIDEIHRFNKAQQDAFLPYVESGDIVLIGATTENPSFEVNTALLSRMRVHVLQRLSLESLQSIIRRALDDAGLGLGEHKLEIDSDALELLAAAADGDARRALTLLEETAVYLGYSGKVTVAVLRQIHQKSAAVYDKTGEEHYNLISALHKTIRDGDPDAALYWLARMIDGGEEPLYIVRRLIRFATEDIGLADPYALTLALNARETYRFLGSPEGDLSIALLVIYMACAPKSNSVYMAYAGAVSDAQKKGSLPVPLHLRNAPTALMKGLGYGNGYQYAHDYDEALTDQSHFPEELGDREYYRPTDRGREQRLQNYLDKYRNYRKQMTTNKKTPPEDSAGS